MAINVVEMFKRIHLFRDIDDQRLEAAAALVREVNHPSGDVIFQQGAIPDLFYFIAGGVMQLLVSIGKQVFFIVGCNNFTVINSYKSIVIITIFFD